MIQRIRQFVRASRAHVSDEERRYVEQHLPSEAQPLFFAMDEIDQCHALNVARTATELANHLPSGLALDRDLLLRVALLHDAGRRRGDMGIWGKVLAVLAHHFFPQESRAWARERRNSRGFCAWLRHVLYVYYHHAAIGAELLRGIGMEREARIVALHHLPQREDDVPELRLLREADERN